MRHLALSLSLALFGSVSPAAAQSLHLAGPDGRVAEMSVEAVGNLPRVTVAFEAHGVAHVYEGPLLIDVLKIVGAPTGREIHGQALADVILATAADGYQVAYGLAEADPGTRANRMILADHADGAPLSAEVGPFQLVVEGDLRPARSIHQVVSLEVRSLATVGVAAH